MSDRLQTIVFYILTVLIILSISAFLYFLFFENTDTQIMILGSFGLLVLMSVWLAFEFVLKRKKEYIVPVEKYSPIRRFVLMTIDGDREQEWCCDSNTSLLIGKGTTTSEVDIELGDTSYSEYISNEHAVLNCTGGFWYIEDLESTNGVGLKKKGDEYALRLKPLVSYKIDEGDIIYISKAKILVR